MSQKTDTHSAPTKKSLLSWIFAFSEEKTSRYVASIVLACLSVACSILAYVFVARIVALLLSGGRDWGVYVRLCAIIALFWLGNSVFHAFSTTLSHVATFSVLGNIRKRLCDKLARVPLGAVLNLPSGSLKNTLVERIDSMETTLAHIIPEYTSNLLLPVALIAYIFALDWHLALASLITLPIGLVAMMTMFINYEKPFKRALETTQILNDTAVEYINGIEVIKAFGKSKSSYERFVTAAEDNAASFIDWMRANIWQMSVSLTVTPATLVSVLPVGGFMVLRGTISPVTFITVIILSLSLIQPLLTVFTYHDDLAKAGIIFGEIGAILEMPELDRPQTDRITPKDNSITLKDVHFSYRKGEVSPSLQPPEAFSATPSAGDTPATPPSEILHGISMTLPEGSCTALVGPSGSGKSTIARLIASLWDVDSGAIEIGGVNIKDLSLEAYNRRVAFVSQDTFLFDRTVRENIRMGKPGATDAEVEAIARASGCYDFIMSLENGFDTLVGGSGAHLSGGERQRIAIARAMMKDAPIVILDEATAYTDPENEAIIQQSVARLVKGKTLIVIAHRLSTVSDADKIFVIQNGVIAEQGTHQELLSRGGLYHSMWEAHLSAKDTDSEVA